MISCESVLNRVYNFCPNYKQLIINRVLHVLNRIIKVSLLSYFRIFFCPKQGQGFKPSAAHLYLNMGGVPPPRDKWLVANKLTFNKSKTEFMLIGSRQKLSSFSRSSSITIGGGSINRVASTKSLGVYIYENLSWSLHIDTISKKIASGIGALKRSRSFVSLKRSGLCIYNALNVRPHFDYCSVVWGSCNKTLSTKLQKLQNRSARILTFSSYMTLMSTISLKYLAGKN